MTIAEAASVKYVARPGASFSDDRAKVLGPWVDDLIKRYGEDKAREAFVEEAAAPDHHAHDLLEWDDAKCGRQYRLQQAQCHIRHIGIELPDGTRPNLPAFITLKIETAQAENDGDTPPTSRTIPILEAMTEDDSRKRAFRQAMVIVHSQRARLEEFSNGEADNLIHEIDVLWRRLTWQGEGEPDEQMELELASAPEAAR